MNFTKLWFILIILIHPSLTKESMGEERWIVFEIIIFCRRHKEKKEEVAQPEADPERDQRTVFAYQVL